MRSEDLDNTRHCGIPLPQIQLECDTFQLERVRHQRPAASPFGNCQSGETTERPASEAEMTNTRVPPLVCHGSRLTKARVKAETPSKFIFEACAKQSRNSTVHFLQLFLSLKWEIEQG